MTEKWANPARPFEPPNVQQLTSQHRKKTTIAIISSNRSYRKKNNLVPFKTMRCNRRVLFNFHETTNEISCVVYFCKFHSIHVSLIIKQHISLKCKYTNLSNSDGKCLISILKIACILCVFLELIYLVWLVCLSLVCLNSSWKKCCGLFSL